MNILKELLEASFMDKNYFYLKSSISLFKTIEKIQLDKTNILAFSFWSLFDKVFFGSSQVEVCRAEIYFLKLKLSWENMLSFTSKWKCFYEQFSRKGSWVRLVRANTPPILCCSQRLQFILLKNI